VSQVRQVLQGPSVFVVLVVSPVREVSRVPLVLRVGVALQAPLGSRVHAEMSAKPARRDKKVRLARLASVAHVAHRVSRASRASVVTLASRVRLASMAGTERTVPVARPVSQVLAALAVPRVPLVLAFPVLLVAPVLVVFLVCRVALAARVHLAAMASMAEEGRRERTAKMARTVRTASQARRVPPGPTERKALRATAVNPSSRFTSTLLRATWT